jgi:poly(A) polymerase
MAQSPEKEICGAGFPAYLHSFSAIDSYLGRSSPSSVYVIFGADLPDLARLFEGLRYPGAAFADAALDWGGKTWYFRCGDSQPIRRFNSPNFNSFGFLEFFQDCKTRRFYDPNSVYPALRRIRDGTEHTAEQWLDAVHAETENRKLFDGAVILAKYFPETPLREIKKMSGAFSFPAGAAPPCAEEQRLLLTSLLEAANPAPGFELLKQSGFIASCWPELAVLDDVDQSKEFHPEGNVWKHTMEALRYRKAAGHSFDLRLSLGLLLHDAGKPLSESTGNRRFNGHAELGERQARRFLERLGFDAALVRDACYLVRNHMLPAALPRLPLARTGEIMASPLFPALLELYRCDESSSFKGLDGYYHSSAAYRAYLKNKRNPYRSADGKKLSREEIIYR